jgi:hypothetical protein
MAEVHRDWQVREEKGAADTMCCDTPSILPISTRLVNAKTARGLQEGREAMGLVTQMRDDHAPFTVNREKDHGAFLNAMKKDALADPDTIDNSSDLLRAESRAYSWALEEPALIPYWMHPIKDIPKTGATRKGDAPWYRNFRERSEVTKSRPHRPWLPDYLKAREDEINRLLKMKKHSAAAWDKLERLLDLHEPLELRELHLNYLREEHMMSQSEAASPPETKKLESLEEIMVR